MAAQSEERRGSHRRPIVGVMGSGTEDHADQAEPLGRWLAGLGVHLLTGGGGGVMERVGHAFFETPGRRGLVIGIVPAGRASIDPRSGYPNRWVELPIRTHLPLTGDRGTDPRSRNHINVLSSDVLVALPGGAGTLSEIRLSLAYGRPLVGFLEHRDQIAGLPEQVPVFADLAGIKKFVERALARDARG